MPGRRLSVSYNDQSRLYRVISTVGITEYPPGRTLIKEQVDQLIREGVLVSIKSAVRQKPKDPWELVFAAKGKRR